MANSLARALPFAPRAAARLALLLLLLDAIAPLSTGGANPNLLASTAQHVSTAAHGGEVGSDNVLVFQTSWNITVPCSTPVINPPSGHQPPYRVIIASPTESGTYPVILFKHGFLLANCLYTQLFESLASSGYIIVAPQASTAAMVSTTSTREIEETANVTKWIQESLAIVLEEAVSNANVYPNMLKLVMAGHSRGGKVAFAMALGIETAVTELPSFSALVTLDPVDGTSLNNLLYPPLVAAGCNHTRNQISFPVLILGTGYGSESAGFLLPPCAPRCCSHMAYFNCSSSPIIYHLVASKYGHLDFLDDSIPIWSQLITGTCKSGTGPNQALRDFSTQLIVAFLNSALDGQLTAMDNIIENWQSANITLDKPLVYSQHSALNHISKTLPLEKHFEV